MNAQLLEFIAIALASTVVAMILGAFIGKHLESLINVVEFILALPFMIILYPLRVIARHRQKHRYGYSEGDIVEYEGEKYRISKFLKKRNIRLATEEAYQAGLLGVGIPGYLSVSLKQLRGQ